MLDKSVNHVPGIKCKGCPELHKETTDIDGWRWEFRREGASPPLKFFPPFKQTYNRVLKINLFERGSKGENIYNLP